ERLAKEHKIGEDEGRKLILSISQNLLAIGVRPINCFPVKYEDINKVIAVKITGGSNLYPDPKNLRGSFDSPARGKTAMSSYDDEAPKIRFFLVLKDNKLMLKNKEVKITEEHFWKIHRIGSKESIVSVSSVKLVDVESQLNSAVTNYSFPVTNEIYPKKVIVESWKDESYISPFKMSEYSPISAYLFGKSTIAFKVPIKVSLSDPSYYVEFNKNLVAYSYKDEEAVIGWLQ
ncbi:MAG: type I-A CRISPR-associated protein Cas5a, partial [Thermoproteota archaeon]